MKKIGLFAGAVVLSCASVAMAQPCNEWQKITAPDAEAGDRFGVSIAVDENWLVIAAQSEDSAGQNAGAIYVYRWTGVNWSFHQKLVATDAAADDNLGHPLSIQGDMIVAGAQLADNLGPNSRTGAAYAFRLVGSTWVFQQKLLPALVTAGDEFGYDISIDGNRLAIGANGTDIAGRERQGAVYIFERSGNTWVEVQRIVASDGDVDDRFGFSLDLDGDTLAIGAPYDSHPGAGAGGSVYIYNRVGSSWLFTTKLQLPNPVGLDLFGSQSDGIDLSGDSLLIGALLRDDGPLLDAGAMYGCQRTNGTWAISSVFRSRLGSLQGGFGDRLRHKGSDALVGASGSDLQGLNSGSAHAFSRASGRWNEYGIGLIGSDTASGDFFGISVDFDDRFYFVSAYTHDLASTPGEDHGAVYVFRRVDCAGLPDCNANFIDDREDIASGVATDINDNLIPDSCEPGVCAVPGGGDANGDGMVNFTDIGAVLANFGAMCP